jgi:hypothetical protein
MSAVRGAKSGVALTVPVATASENKDIAASMGKYRLVPQSLVRGAFKIVLWMERSPWEKILASAC